MVSFSNGAMSVEEAGSYYQVHYSAAGYYAGTEQGIIGHAVGRGAQMLGLGEVTADQFNAVLRGQDPTTQAALRIKATHGDTERAGWDCTISPPKSISIQGSSAAINGWLRRTAKRRSLLSARPNPAPWPVGTAARSGLRLAISLRSCSSIMIRGNRSTARMDRCRNSTITSSLRT
jgi:TrwC relaxase